MITTVTLNPCIDLTLRISDFKPGELNRTDHARTDIGGKGLNVSMVLRAFGLPTICTGINFDGNGQQLADKLEENCISGRFAMAHGNIRTNIKLFDEHSREMTEINQAGQAVDEVVLDEYIRLMRECARTSQIVVFSGRTPGGKAEDIYRRSLKAIRDLPCKTIVDAEGRALRLALMQKPYLIKPNLRELEILVKRKITGPQDAARAGRDILRRGVKVVCVSMGSQGAVIVDENRAFFAPALSLAVQGLQGAGDSMVAGLCRGMKEGLDIDDMLRYGVAAASASLIREGTLLCRQKDFDHMLPMVAVEHMDISGESAYLMKNRKEA